MCTGGTPVRSYLGVLVVQCGVQPWRQEHEGDII